MSSLSVHSTIPWSVVKKGKIEEARWLPSPCSLLSGLHQMCRRSHSCVYPLHLPCDGTHPLCIRKSLLSPFCHSIEKSNKCKWNPKLPKISVSCFFSFIVYFCILLDTFLLTYYRDAEGLSGCTKSVIFYGWTTAENAMHLVLMKDLLLIKFQF